MVIIIKQIKHLGILGITLYPFIVLRDKTSDETEVSKI